MEQQLQELHDLKSYLGLKLAQHLAAGGRTDDPFVRSVWDLHGELAAALDEVARGLDGDVGVELEDEDQDQDQDREGKSPDELSNIGYLRWVLESEQV